MSAKTIKEWFAELPEEIRARAEKNLGDYGPGRSWPIESLSDAITQGFIWSDTLEGSDFWINIYDRAEENKEISDDLIEQYRSRFNLHTVLREPRQFPVFFLPTKLKIGCQYFTYEELQDAVNGCQNSGRVWKENDYIYCHNGRISLALFEKIVEIAKKVGKIT